MSAAGRKAVVHSANGDSWTLPTFGGMGLPQKGGGQRHHKPSGATERGMQHQHAYAVSRPLNTLFGHLAFGGAQEHKEAPGKAQGGSYGGDGEGRSHQSTRWTGLAMAALISCSSA
jgi:hypothetical protein